MNVSVWSRLASWIRLVLVTFIVSGALIALTIFMGWADEPLNAWVESNARNNMTWLQRTLHDASGPQDAMARIRREDFDLFTQMSLAFGVAGGMVVAGTVGVASALLGWTKPRAQKLNSRI